MPTPDPRCDPVFGLPTPLLFAHRGGVREAPEGTRFAFERALREARADVLELDLQRSSDGELVVWHGPELDNVFIDGVSSQPAQRTAGQNDIRNHAWSELEGHAWVTGPPPYPLDLSGIDKSDDRRLLSFRQYLELFPGVPTNIELKTGRDGSIGHEDLDTLIRILDADQDRRTRELLVVTTNHGLIKRFREKTRERSGKRYATGFSAREVVAARLKALAFLPQSDCENRSLQSTHSSALSPRRLIEAVQKKKGAVHLFLTKFGPMGAIDAKDGEPTPAQLRPLVERGVDGIMTDRPVQVRRVLESLGSSPDP
jgi:glycerophosphoryl diester phosphodiesterase